MRPLEKAPEPGERLTMDRSNTDWGRVLRLASWALSSLILMVVVAGITLTVRGRDALQKSDNAFHEGRTQEAVVFAREAALNYVPGSAHVRAAHERIEAIARGAEARGERQLARFAWDTLRVVHLKTDYPGRVVPPGLERARAGLARLDQAAAPEPP
jgi:hypothetical protein